jgi:hypothetical protein
MKSGMGLNGFVWWEGVVEDRMDPLGLGRCRVRVFGFDSESRLNSDRGQVHAPKEGTWVIGFFRDGEDAQDRVIFGTIDTGAYRP